jgi:hypothetical protein
LQNPLGRDTGNLDPNQKWEYNLVRPGVWANDAGEEIDLSYLPNSEQALSGYDIMKNAGALPSGSNKSSSTGQKTDEKTASNTKSLPSETGGTTQIFQAPSQDPTANIKLMEELFGGDTTYKLRELGAPRNQASTDMDALARLLRNQNA